ncbi:glycosyltransferase [bacterium]|nr:glycosyltransferase [bacterium]
MKKVINLLFNDFTNDNRVFKESRTLVNNGYDVTLVATHFDKELSKEECIEGINVKRFNVGRIKLLPLNLILFWFIIIKNFRKERIFHANDLYALPPAYVIKKFFNRDVKIVYDCHEHETEAKIYLNKPIIKRIAKIFERHMISSADAVITVSESIAMEYEQMYGIEKPVLVLNNPLYMENRKYNLFREELGIPEDKEIFLFQGAYIRGRGIETLINVFKKMEKDNKNIVLVFLVYGEGVNKLKEEIKGIGNIFWHEKVSIFEYMKYVSSADWGIYLMENICLNHDLALPNKIFDYIMGRLPIVVSNLKEMSKFVEENKVGYLINPEDEDSILKVLRDIDKDTKKKYLPNLEKVAKKFCWEEQEKVLINIYKNL